ncbi:MAG: hypothetical protein MJA83_08505, partial [Gammaproteobacteria bacterium]|nr:hypothetical protein [Gammaproteobacteria bacterium]
MSQLQDFREKYPQYADLTDEELAASLHRRFYSDVPVVEFRRQLGLPELATEPEEPTLFERVKNVVRRKTERPDQILSDKPVRFDEFDFDSPSVSADESGAYGGSGLDAGEPSESSPLLRDQFFAGFDQYRANRAATRSLDLMREYQDIERVARGELTDQPTPGFLGVPAEQITRFARAAQADAGDEQAIQAIARETTRRRTELEATLQQMIDKRAELTERASTVPFSDPTQRMLEAGSVREALTAAAEDPLQVIAEISLRSLPNMAEALPLAYAGSIFGPVGFAAGLGIGSGMAEYRSALSEYLEREGVDLTSAASIMDAVENEELLNAAREYALTRSTV